MATVFGLEVADLDEGFVPIEAMVWVKTLDADGHDSWVRRGTDGLGDLEVIGMMHCDIARTTEQFNGRWVESGDEDDGDG